MAISIFPSTAAEFVSNNFVIDMNDTSNNTADTGGVKQAGPYSISLSSGDSSFDVYLIDEDGNSVGYSNNTSIVASGLFSTVVIFGVAQDEVISFLYQGSVNNADGEGDEPGAGAYLESISPSDLPSIDDTATVIGGNFGADTEIYFDSGQTSLEAKNITVNNSAELIVTRPDGLIEDDSPYTVRAVTTGVPEPTGTNANILTDAVTAGSDPTWVTGPDLTLATINVAYNETLEATDSDGTVVDYSVTAGALPTGLSLNSSTGVISGTPTASGQTFTVTATDDGGNESTREFTLPIALATGGTITADENFIYHTFTSSDDFEALTTITDAEYLLVAGGGAGGPDTAGAGGAGGLLDGTATISSGIIPVTIGDGGVSASTSSNGSDSSFGIIATAIGGGKGGGFDEAGFDGGSGGGAGGFTAAAGGSGTAGQGNDGGPGSGDSATGGGGGAGTAGGNLTPGDGLQFSDFATATTTGADGGYYAGGGAGGDASSSRSGGLGGGGGAISAGGLDGVDGTGGGGGGGYESGDFNGDGGSGILIVRYA